MSSERLVEVDESKCPRGRCEPPVFGCAKHRRAHAAPLAMMGENIRAGRYFLMRRAFNPLRPLVWCG
ncbi:hypothetical protein FTUN_0232 [Frigoriglobus tundricola]|uniref:Uncharacterized protein n=1 Tax=Frigoriglobus tundricola TaxID=2774151 RepID=A0A6M5YFE0_9BACT|nr:hypothetical protein FTUN_0232 [Frigoriglobus tundricola]